MRTAEWDPAKARANLLKHGVRGRVIVVVHTMESVSRIISARRATRKERRKYEEGI